jgi:hypothetical protein
LASPSWAAQEEAQALTGKDAADRAKTNAEAAKEKEEALKSARERQEAEDREMITKASFRSFRVEGGGERWGSREDAARRRFARERSRGISYCRDGVFTA